MHLIRSAYGCDEYEILWRDWHWVDYTLRRIIRDRNEIRRWDLQSSLVSAVYATHGEEHSNGWKQMFDMTFTPEERIAQRKAKEAEEMELMEQQRMERHHQMIAMQEEARRIAKENGNEEPDAEKQIFFIRQ